MSIDPPTHVSPINAINLCMSDFVWSNAPSREIDLAISWLEGIAHDCHFKITRLRALKSDRDRAKAHKQKRRAVAKLFDDPDFLTIDPENQLAIIQQRLGADCTRQRAVHVRSLVLSRLKGKNRKDRDRRIMAEYRAGKSAIEIAEQEDLTRQQVYNIIKRYDKPLL